MKEKFVVREIAYRTEKGWSRIMIKTQAQLDRFCRRIEEKGDVIETFHRFIKDGES